MPADGQLQISSLAPGKHIIKATLEGFLDAYRMIEIPSGTHLTVDIDLALFDPAGTLDPALTALDAGEPIQGRGGASAPFVVDWDNDGKKDIVVAGGDGSVVLYGNIGSDAVPVLADLGPILADGAPLEVDGPAVVSVADWNNDGGKDLIMGDGDGNVHLFLNTLADSHPVLAASELIPAGGLPVQGPAFPVVVDWNNDGKKDLVWAPATVPCGSSAMILPAGGPMPPRCLPWA